MNNIKILFLLLLTSCEVHSAPQQQSAGIYYMGQVKPNLDLYRFQDEFDSTITCYIVEGNRYDTSISCVKNSEKVK